MSVTYCDHGRDMTTDACPGCERAAQARHRPRMADVRMPLKTRSERRCLACGKHARHEAHGPARRR